MNLYEFEGERLFEEAGIAVPQRKVIERPSEVKKIPKTLLPAIVKAQTIIGKRKKARAVIPADTQKEVAEAVKELLGKELRGEEVSRVLVGKRVSIEDEYFLSITYDTGVRAPVLLASPKGGIDVEELARKHPKSIARLSINPLTGPGKKGLQKVFSKKFPKKVVPQLIDIAQKLWQVFEKNDAKLVETNPLILTRAGKLVAADAKVILDDFALFRHSELGFSFKDTVGRISRTEAELAARKIDENDYRGTAGSVYFDLPGDIAIIASGGGGSLVCMDALLAHGGKPANYTEYSGNPPAEKVEKLTRIALSKPGLAGCWVVGGTANFTDIYETMRGFLAGLKKSKPKPHYPIVIRREGPRTKEAFEMLRKVAQKEGFDIHIYDNKTSVAEAAKIMARLAQEYRRNEHTDR